MRATVATSSCVADLRELSWVAVGAKYGVSDNAVRKWMRRYERGAGGVSAPEFADGSPPDRRSGRYAPPPMRTRLAAATVAALLLPATAALGRRPGHAARRGAGRDAVHRLLGRARDRGGAFAIEVIDVIDDRATRQRAADPGPASGPAVDETGIGPGFSGSPIYCPDAQGTPRVIGAISESIGEYGGKVVLATPIEAILGNPVDAPRAAGRGARGAARAARPLAAPLTVTGLNPRLGSALQQAAAKRGRLVLAAPAGPLGSFPVQQLRPGSAFGVGYASGDIAASAIGTVTYTDGDRVWGFGHPLDGVGARSLLLQDAYVFRVINNPLAIVDVAGTYKYAAAGHDVGTLTNDALSAVVGRVGGAARRPCRCAIFATDLDTGAKRTRRSRTSPTRRPSTSRPAARSSRFIAPLAVTQAAGTVLGGSPARLTGRACFAIAFKERKRAGALLQPLRVRPARRARRRQRGRGRGEHRPARARSR